MAIVLSILKIIGIVLLWILGIVLALLLLLLFFPIRYRVKARYDGSYEVKAKGWWLFHLLHISASIGSKSELSYGVRILGIRIYPGKKEEKAPDDLDLKNLDFEDEVLYVVPSEEKEPSEKTASSEGITPVEETASLEKEVPSEKATASEQTVPLPEPKTTTEKQCERKETRQKEEKKKKPEKEPEPLYQRFCRFLDKLEKWSDGLHKKVSRRIRQYEDLDWLLHSKLFEVAFTEGKRDAFKILHQLLPRKIAGKLHFGFEDPALTGEAYAGTVTVLTYIPHTKKLCVLPDFDQKTFDADMTCTGYFMLAPLLIPAFRLYKNKKIRNVIKKFRRIIHG